MCRPAKLIARGAHQQWSCPCCGRTLGEVYDDRVVVKAGERILSFPASAPVEQTCPRCGTVSAVGKREDTAA